MDVARCKQPNRSDMLILNLARNPDGQIFVNSLELTGELSHNRTTFKGAPGLEQVLSSKLAQHLADLIEQARDSTMLLLSDLTLNLGDLLLHGCRILNAPAKNGVEFIMVRFKTLRGRLSAIFHDDYCTQPALKANGNPVSRNILETLFLKIFNLETHLDLNIWRRSLTALEENAVKSIKRDIQDLRTHADLYGYFKSRRETGPDAPLLNRSLPGILNRLGTEDETSPGKPGTQRCDADS